MPDESPFCIASLPVSTVADVNFFIEKSNKILIGSIYIFIILGLS